MNITEKMIEKAKTAASAADLMKIAEAEGITLTEEEAEQYFAFYFKNGELSDDELENIAGGKGSKHANAQYHSGQHVKWLFGTVYLTGTITNAAYVDLQKAWYYTTYADNGQIFQGESCDGKKWDLPLELSVYHTEVLN